MFTLEEYITIYIDEELSSMNCLHTNITLNISTYFVLLYVFIAILHSIRKMNAFTYNMYIERTKGIHD